MPEPALDHANSALKLSCLPTWLLPIQGADVLDAPKGAFPLYPAGAVAHFLRAGSGHVPGGLGGNPLSLFYGPSKCTSTSSTFTGF